jgi:hypothetical protein
MPTACGFDAPADVMSLAGRTTAVGGGRRAISGRSSPIVEILRYETVEFGNQREEGTGSSS